MRPLGVLRFAALALSLLGGACSSMNVVSPAQPTAVRQMLPDQRVITDTGLYRRVRIVGINTATGAAGFLKIQVEVENTTSNRQSFTYRVEWFDETGMIVSLPTTASIPRTLEARESAMITATAPTSRAKDFRIKFLDPMN